MIPAVFIMCLLKALFVYLLDRGLVPLSL
jgi:preprotein translocase subunit SecE